MKRRSKVRATAAKARRRKSRPKRASALDDTTRLASLAAGEEGELARLTRDLNEAVQQQTATADVLKVISRSTFDLQTVLNTVLETAARICGADKGSIQMRDGQVFRIRAHYCYPREGLEHAEATPLKADRSSMTGRVATEGKAVQIDDVLADPEYRLIGYQQTIGFRTVLGVPLLREGATIGVFVLTRDEVNQFTEQQIALVQSFADQAVIAIENARLLSELRQSLEEQTATSEVLRVISSSPGELEPVFTAMLASGTRICEAEFGNLFLREEEAFRAVAWHGEPTYVNTWRGPALTIKTDVKDIPLARLATTKQRVHVADSGRNQPTKRAINILWRSSTRVEREPFLLCR
jgi:two-component system, NtrC family, sensor kinase